MMRIKFIPLLTVLLLSMIGSMPINSANAQAENEKNDNIFKMRMSAVDEITAMSGKYTIRLWGIKTFGESDAKLKLQARVSLDNIIGKSPLECSLKQRDNNTLIAQCINDQDIDLGLYMLQNGFALVDRASVYGSVFEDPYIQAELDAQEQRKGIWQERESARNNVNTTMLITVSVILILIVIGIFIALSIFIMRGFQRVIDAQNKNMELTKKERALKDKEKEIFSHMLDSEIKANKSKLEAYIIVYDEVLKSLQDTTKTPKYQTSGDIVQQQPALSRSIFDRNTEKLDVLGTELSSEVIHFYARIKTNAEYTNLDPDMALIDAVAIVEKALKNAHRLDNIADRLIDSFSEKGLSAPHI